jgi:hypothetical protein
MCGWPSEAAVAVVVTQRGRAGERQSDYTVLEDEFDLSILGFAHVSQ